MYLRFLIICLVLPLAFFSFCRGGDDDRKPSSDEANLKWTKNAATFGFLPTASATENVAALQNAVKGGGTILVDYPGVYEVNDTIRVPSNTTIIFGANVIISLTANKRFLCAGPAKLDT